MVRVLSWLGFARKAWCARCGGEQQVFFASLFFSCLRTFLSDHLAGDVGQ
jgi:hypothetical protein